MVNKLRPSDRPPASADLAPQSQVRIRHVPERTAPLPNVDEQLEALWQRYEADEITLDEATEAMKQISLGAVKRDLTTADYEFLAEYMKTMPVD
jgi:hypothetical protein